ncbi:caspase family protein [Lewinella sp. W8]|uniref:nSTAND1 domain-containing NTPase n=1 Tax=Lewinella sp. W8 TaxID=2528208 RepID=UPI00106816CD|nr:caspase family protein [Lewinella sp. W8]MTB51695.1 hypothetical protein [Lewinella sp. W8]
MPENNMKKYAFLVGVKDYGHLNSLSTPLNDIRALGDLLSKEFDFEVDLCENPNIDTLKDYFGKHIPDRLGGVNYNAQVLVYFAGHGFAENSEDGINGYLIPSNGVPWNKSSWYSMEKMIDCLGNLEVKHLLLLLDCCFGGAIRWASRYRASNFLLYNKLSIQHYKYFIESPSWQVLTSTAPNQSALDFIDHGLGADHSPFAKCILDGLKGEADLNPDKVITTSELFTYVQNRLTVISNKNNNKQNAGLYPLKKHNNGEFLFFMDGFNPDDLNPIHFRNPYKGLGAYDTSDEPLFFGRKDTIVELLEKIKDEALTVVIGASGIGKSSLVKAGIVPRLSENLQVEIIEPGRRPLKELNNIGVYDILIVDQLEQLVTQSNKVESLLFWKSIEKNIVSGKKIIVTVRIDFEKQLGIPEVLEKKWQSGRYLVPPFSTEELREIIVTPALRVGRFFQPINLVDEIIDEVIHYPGSLPLLSFTMEQLFENCKDDLFRNISKAEYVNLGGVTGALQTSADQTYQSLGEKAVKVTKEQATMCKLLLRMVSISGGETAGKRVYSYELEFDSQEENVRIARVLKLLIDKRLINARKDFEDQVYYEPSHDALVRTWRMMQGWIKEIKAENLLLHSRLGNAILDFERNKIKSKFLWHNNANLQLIEESPLSLNRKENSFVNASKNQRRWNTIKVWSVVFVAFAIISGLGIYANKERKSALTTSSIYEADNLILEGDGSVALRILSDLYADNKENSQLLYSLSKLSTGKANLYDIILPGSVDFWVSKNRQNILVWENEGISIFNYDGSLISSQFSFDPVLYQVPYSSDLLFDYYHEGSNSIVMEDSIGEFYLWNYQENSLSKLDLAQSLGNPTKDPFFYGNYIITTSSESDTLIVFNIAGSKRSFSWGSNISDIIAFDTNKFAVLLESEELIIINSEGIERRLPLDKSKLGTLNNFVAIKGGFVIFFDNATVTYSTSKISIGPSNGMPIYDSPYYLEDSSQIVLYNENSGKLVQYDPYKQIYLNSIQMDREIYDMQSSENKKISVVSSDSTLLILNSELKKISEYRHFDEIDFYDISPKEDFILLSSGNSDNTLQVINLYGHIVGTYNQSNAFIEKALFLSDEKIWLLSRDGNSIIWEWNKIGLIISDTISHKQDLTENYIIRSNNLIKSGKENIKINDWIKIQDFNGDPVILKDNLFEYSNTNYYRVDSEFERIGAYYNGSLKIFDINSKAIIWSYSTNRTDSIIDFSFHDGELTIIESTNGHINLLFYDNALNRQSAVSVNHVSSRTYQDFESIDRNFKLLNFIDERRFLVNISKGKAIEIPLSQQDLDFIQIVSLLNKTVLGIVFQDASQNYYTDLWKMEDNTDFEVPDLTVCGIAKNAGNLIGVLPMRNDCSDELRFIDSSFELVFMSSEHDFFNRLFGDRIITFPYYTENITAPRIWSNGGRDFIEFELLSQYESDGMLFIDEILPDNLFIGLYSELPSLYCLWDGKGKIITTLKRQDANCNDEENFDTSLSRKMFATTCYDGLTRIYNFEGSLINEVRNSKDFAYTTKFVGDGEYLYVETIDSFKVWLVDHSKMLDKMAWILE